LSIRRITRGGFFTGGGVNVTPAAMQTAAAVVVMPFLTFAAYTAAVTPDAFQRAGQLPKIGASP